MVFPFHLTINMQCLVQVTILFVFGVKYTHNNITTTNHTRQSYFSMSSDDPAIDFSELYKHSGGHCTWSPDGKYLAVATKSTLVIRDVDDMSVVNLFNCADEIKHIEWSFDSMYILCGIYGRAIVDVWCVHKTDWTCRITEGVAFLVPY